MAGTLACTLALSPALSRTLTYVGVHLHCNPRLSAVEDARLQGVGLGAVLGLVLGLGPVFGLGLGFAVRLGLRLGVRVGVRVRRPLACSRLNSGLYLPLSPYISLYLPISPLYLPPAAA